MAVTMKIIAIFSFVASLSLFIVEGANHCNVPPRFWCENEEVATKCGVLNQCQEFMREEEGKKVQLVLYYESLCPDCQRFITKMLYPNYFNLTSIMNLTMVPFGNAYERKVGDRWEFQCQHGKQECIGNIIETCSIALMNDRQGFPFFNCMELQMSYIDPEQAAKKCAKSFPVPIDEILKCSKSDMGNRLEHEMALKTKALDPPHQYVPWVTVNGIHTEAIQKEAESNLVKLICDTYKGPKPPVCS